MSGGASPKKQRRSYSGKKRRHTQKAQVVADQKTRQLLATAFSAGKMHDFKLFERSRTALPKQTKGLADSGYLGLVKHHQNSHIPHKKSKLHPLTKEQKAENRQLARERFVAEHIIRRLKIFRILSERYRNRRKRFGLRFTTMNSTIDPYARGLLMLSDLPAESLSQNLAHLLILDAPPFPTYLLSKV